MPFYVSVLRSVSVFLLGLPETMNYNMNAQVVLTLANLVNEGINKSIVCILVSYFIDKHGWFCSFAIWFAWF